MRIRDENKKDIYLLINNPDKLYEKHKDYFLNTVLKNCIKEVKYYEEVEYYIRGKFFEKIEIFKNQYDGKNNSKLKTYLTAFFRNSCIDWLRQNKKRIEA